MMCSETCGFEMSPRILSDITNATLGMLGSLVPFSNPSSATVIALLGPQASSPATVARHELEWRRMQARTPAVPEERSLLHERGY